jgi:zinc transporter
VTELPEIIAYGFDGRDKAVRLDVAQIDDKSTTPYAFTWVHLRRDNEAARSWLETSGLDSFVIEALTADETRPRCTVHGDGVVLNLRGVNLNPGAEPEDMISVRFWLERRRIIGVWVRELQAVSDLTLSIERNQAPTTPGDLIAKLALRLADRAEPTVGELNDRIDDIEDEVIGQATRQPRRELADIRRSAITLRRHMVPQRDALTTLEIEDLDWLSNHDRSRIREAADRVTRLGEELEAIRDRAQILHDELMDQRAEAMNKNTLLLSVVASIFLPLGLLTGLLGINVGGIPGAQEPWAFWIVCLVLLVIAVAQFLLLRLFGFFR